MYCLYRYYPSHSNYSCLYCGTAIISVFLVYRLVQGTVETVEANARSCYMAENVLHYNMCSHTLISRKLTIQEHFLGKYVATTMDCSSICLLWFSFV